LRITFTNEVLLDQVKLILAYRHNIYADTVCIYAGQTGGDALGCIYNNDDFETEEVLPIDGHMLATRQIFIEFNGARNGVVRELEVDYKRE